MLTFEQIKELIDQVASHRLSGLELERSGFRLKIDGQQVAGTAAAGSVHVAMPPVAAEEPAVVSRPASPSGPAAPAAAEGPEALPESVHVLSSPIVGTFYAAPNPDSPSFVKVGDQVFKGQVLCIVEAMKLMNEIEADVDGVIREIYPENGQPVEYGERLFAIDT